jgi:LysR family transcriptional activator of mexEF-oprN operon
MDLDLNLLKVLVAVADSGSVTAAAGRLYVTQSAVSAALKRLSEAVGAPLLARAGRGVALTTRGRRIVDRARPLLDALVRATLSGEEPHATTRVVRLGLSDTAEGWLLGPLLAAIAGTGPRVRLVVLPVQFRTVGEMLASGRVDLAVSVADELPAGVLRKTLFVGEFVCLFDPRTAKLGRSLDRAEYLAQQHVVVSYNGDLRGIIEDVFGVSRDVRLSVPSFAAIGAVVEGSRLVATVPRLVAAEIRRTRPTLRTLPLPFPLRGTPMELLGRAALADDEVLAAVEAHITAIAARATRRVR